MAARRAVQAKALASNGPNNSSHLGQTAPGSLQQPAKSRLKSTSMTNLLVGSDAKRVSSEPQGGGGGGGDGRNGGSLSRAHNKSGSNGHLNVPPPRQLQRPASRNALDSIHKGMNARFTHVQSKVLLQNIRPQQPQQQQGSAGTPSASRIPGPSERASTLQRPGVGARRQAGSTTPTAARVQQSDRSQLINRIKTLQEELERKDCERDELRAELERERADRAEQLQQAKLELEERVAENERQNEDYHQKLLEAYELADQNRRAADSVLAESRQREDELRRRIEELEGQLAELKEFVAVKEEMVGKMGELREQIRAERERYEEKTRSLNQVFETEKLSNSAGPHALLDQNSNYFRRQRPSLQSVESIDQLDCGERQQQHEPQQQQKHLFQQQGWNKRGGHHNSEQDIYGSKLSTRMQDGARAAWKKSRKFASSVITGSLGGLSACRRNGSASSSDSTGAVHRRTASPSAGLGAPGPLPVGVIDQQPALSGVGQCRVEDELQQQQHTSVVEVGLTVGDFMQQQQQKQQQQQPSIEHQAGACRAPELGEQQRQQAAEASRQTAPESLIRVDANNKLTIVTKFNDSDGAHAAGPQVASPRQQLQASSSGGSGSERSRCESSSSGRGTASDSGSSGSQNGDLEQLDSQHSPCQQQQDRAQVATAGSGDNNDGQTSDADQAQQQTDPRGDQGPQKAQAAHQRHKRKSSLAFKASSVFSGSQASLNKTLKSFFAVAAPTEAKGAAVGRQHRSFDQACTLQAINCLPDASGPGQQQQQRQSRQQSVPRLESFRRTDEDHAAAEADSLDQGDVQAAAAQQSTKSRDDYSHPQDHNDRDRHHQQQQQQQQQKQQKQQDDDHEPEHQVGVDLSQGALLAGGLVAQKRPACVEVAAIH